MGAASLRSRAYSTAALAAPDSGAGAEAAHGAGDAALGVDQRVAAIGAVAGLRDDERSDADAPVHADLLFVRMF